MKLIKIRGEGMQHAEIIGDTEQFHKIGGEKMQFVEK